MTFTDDFDFNDYINDEQDVALVADNHLFESGNDIFGYAPGDPLVPSSSLVGQSFEFPQDTTDLSDPYINYTASNPSAEPEGVERSIVVDPELWNDDPDPLETGNDFPILTPITAPTVNPAAVLHDNYFYPEVATDLLQDGQTMEQEQWETSAIESMQPFFEWQSDAPVEDRLTNQAQIELNSQQIQGLQAQDNGIPGAAIQLLQTAEPVVLHQPTETNSPIGVASSPEPPLPSESRPKRNTRHTPTPAKRNSGLTTSEDAVLGLSFSSLRDAEIAMTSRRVEYDWEPPAADDSIPNTKIERSRYVMDMLTAFQDTSTCKDNKNGYSFIKRWITADYYNIQDIEKVCWHILSVAERLHSEGPSALKIYCTESQRKVHVSRRLTFEERIKAICDCLKYTKSMCDNLMKAEGIETLVGSPKLKMNAARTMVPQNAKRQQWMAQGRNDDPTHASTRASRDSVAVQATDQVSAPLKRKRKTKQPKQPKGAVKSQPEPIASAQIGMSLEASLPDIALSQPTALASGYSLAQTCAHPQITVPPQSTALVHEPSELLRQLSVGLQPSFEKLPTTPTPDPLSSHFSQPSKPYVARKPSKPVLSNPAPIFGVLTKDAPVPPPVSEQPQPVRKPRIKLRNEVRALYVDAKHSKVVSEALNLPQTKEVTKTTTDEAPKTKEYLKSVHDGSDSESGYEEPARPTKRQRKTGESARPKKPESDIARRRRQRKADAKPFSVDDTPIIEPKLTTVVKSATRFSPHPVKPKTTAAPKSTPPVSKKRKAVPDADSEDEQAPRHTKRTKIATTCDARKFALAKPAPVKTGKALRKEVTFANDDARKSAPAKPALIKKGKAFRGKVVIVISDDSDDSTVEKEPVKKGKAMRKIPMTEDSDYSDGDFVPDSDDDSGSDSDFDYEE